jgi:gamma-glutamylputrescine oxidase
MSDAVLDATTWYRATAGTPPQTTPPDALPGHADVCVIGAGLTGLSAALELVTAGYSVAVFDTGPIGWGASGRNGGQVCTGYSPGMDSFENQLGPADAKLCFDVAEEGKQLIRERVETHSIDCHLTWGYVHAAARPSHMDGLKQHKEQLEHYGATGLAMLSRDEARARIASDAYHGGLYEADAGHIHVLEYTLGLARAVLAKGGQIFENARVSKVADGQPATLTLANGATISCNTVIVACNAYLGELVPGLNHRVMPVASYVIATQALGEDRARSLLPDNDAVSDSNYVVDYFRTTEDHRMLFGGRCSYSGIHPRDLAANMMPRLLRIFPQLEGVKADYAWGGHIGITYNRLPDVGRQGRSIWYAHGFSGQGVVISGILGKVLAQAVDGDQSRFDVFAKIRHMPFPGGLLRRPALTLGMLYYRLRDLLS